LGKVPHININNIDNNALKYISMRIVPKAWNIFLIYPLKRKGWFFDDNNLAQLTLTRTLEPVMIHNNGRNKV